MKLLYKRIELPLKRHIVKGAFNDTRSIRLLVTEFAKSSLPVTSMRVYLHQAVWFTRSLFTANNLYLCLFTFLLFFEVSNRLVFSIKKKHKTNFKLICIQTQENLLINIFASNNKWEKINNNNTVIIITILIMKHKRYMFEIG